METSIPLAERLRPKTLEEYLGQNHLVGEETVLRRAIKKGTLPSMIFWGPPGVGKTTLATIISNELNRPFYTLSAINSGVKDIREVIQRVKDQGLFGGNNAILFIDEIHRFSKSQQDSLLGAVEKGIITLIGATTENPSFEVISALLSRCQVYTMKSFSKEDLQALVKRALSQDEVLKELNVEVKEDEALLRLSGGDARKLLNALEISINAAEGKKKVITNDLVKSAVQQNMAMYDKSGEMHFDVISAFIKSIRGSDPNAAVYYLARMVEGGEDPKFIARRLVILASEDIGNANPNALVLATSTFQAMERIGWPEGRIILSQCVIYLASSPKSNASYAAISAAQAEVRESGDLSVPLHIRNAPTTLMKDLGYGKNYEYSHNHEQNFSSQEYLPEEIAGKEFVQFGANKKEQSLAQWLRSLWGKKYKF
jgi:putative ATPase